MEEEVEEEVEGKVEEEGEEEGEEWDGRTETYYRTQGPLNNLLTPLKQPINVQGPMKSPFSVDMTTQSCAAAPAFASLTAVAMRG